MMTACRTSSEVPTTDTTAVPIALALGVFLSPQKAATARRDSLLQPGEYRWTALTDVANQIRICSIRPGPADSKLEVDLCTIDLDEHDIQYSCLSYAWGEKDQTSSISLNDHQHLIHHNLYLQLLRLRANGVTQHFWVDALCINQTDLREQGVQVGMMGRIFSGANRVVLCVDEGGLSVLVNPTDEQVITLQAAIQELSNDSHLDSLSIFAPQHTAQTRDLPLYSNAASQFWRIVSSSYFTRCWTVQEIVLAKDAIILGEWGVMPWSSMVKALRRYNHHRKNCCASFVDTLAEEVQNGCYKVSDPVRECPNEHK